MNEDQFYEMLIYILKWRGHIRSLNSLRSICVFENEKIVIDGFFPFASSAIQEEAPFENLYLGLKKTPTHPGRAVPFGGIKEHDLETISVYIWCEKLVFCRPGNWQSYLLDLYNHIRADQQRYTNLNGKYVHDDDLFPDHW